MNNPRNFDVEIANLEKQLAEVRAKKEKFMAMPFEQRMADILHMATCRWNHADGCSYLYESWDNPREMRNRELNRIRALLEIVDKEKLEQIVLTLK